MELQINNLSYYFSQRLLLSNININIKQDKWIIITGPVGCGKTILSFLISGLIKTDTDCIKLFDNNKKFIRSELIYDVGLIRQNFKQQILFTTTQKELQFGLENRGVNKKTGELYIEETIKKWNIKNKYTKDLSNSEIISLISASYILMGKRFLIFDEIFIHLTIKGKDKLLSLLKKYNVGIIFITQHPEIFKNFTNNIYYLDKTLSKINPKKKEKIKLKKNYFYIKNIKLLKKTWDMLKKTHQVIYVPNEAEDFLFFNSVEEELNWSSISIINFLNYSSFLSLPKNILERNPLSLSGGERRKLIFLISLLKKNEYILIENLALHLDTKSIKEIIELIEILSEKNKKKIIYSIPDNNLFI